jgi:hypothetical protein
MGSKTGVPFPAGARDWSFLQKVQTGSWAHPSSCLINTGAVSSGIKKQGVKLSTNLYPVRRLGMVELYLHFPICCE